MSRNMEQFAAFVPTTQLLASYLLAKRYPGTLYTVAVNMDDYRIRRKLSQFVMSHLRLSNSEAVSCKITSCSCAKTISLFPQNNYSQLRCETVCAKCADRSDLFCYKIYFVLFFYFCCFRKPRKYFYNENFQIYGKKKRKLQLSIKILLAFLVIRQLTFYTYPHQSMISWGVNHV